MKISERPQFGATSWELFGKITKKLAVTPSRYKKPIRIYCDIDGVVKPIRWDDNPGDNEDLKYVQVPMFRSEFYTNNLHHEPHDFGYNPAVVAKLSEWSKRDDVDFVWLTAWRENAPYALDDILDIDSIGFLRWNYRDNDTTHFEKGVALAADQKKNPSKFLWFDDFANKRDYEDVPYFTRGFLTQPDGDNEAEPVFETEEVIIAPERYMAITTSPKDGLSLAETQLVDAWLDLQQG